MMADHHIGSTIRLQATFRNSAGTLTDPSTVVARLLDPRGAETTPTAQNASTGVWYFDTTPTIAGTWFYRFEGSGTVEVSNERSFTVLESKFSSPA